MPDIKEKTCCFTGHRPLALPWKYDEKSVDFVLFKHKLRLEIEKSIDEGFTHFISGMAQGVDMLAAELVLEARKEKNITLECAIPCKNQYKGWSKKNSLRYKEILERADKITLITQEEYTDGCMQKRNVYMVENSSKIIAGYSGRGGGTKQTLTLAYQKALKVVIIDV